MELDSVRELKARIQAQVVRPMVEHLAFASLARAASELPPTRTVRPERLFAVGVSKHPTKKGYRLAVRLQRRSMQDRPELARLTEMAKGEIDIQFVGRIQKRATVPWERQRHRPLRIGTSVGHHKITAGTLGCFVERGAGDGRTVFILSNNHVLANENRASRGDAIVQPGRLDGGTVSRDKVATLNAFVKLKKRHNLLDCALAAIDARRMEFDPTAIQGLGKLAGVSAEPVTEGTRVAKLGRTTGLTRGRVTAFELDDVVVAYDMGNISFDNTIEIEGAGEDAFSDGGDSGSLIVNARRQAVGLLFAGSETGGRNKAGLTYANPIQDVLAALKVGLLFLAWQT
jgi:hypothetical protein